MNNRPRLLITMGDAASIGPEIIARAWRDLNALCCPIVVGDLGRLRWALNLLQIPATARAVNSPAELEPDRELIPCLQGSKEDLSQVVPGRANAAAGRAAYDYLCTAIYLSLGGAAAAIVT